VPYTLFTDPQLGRVGLTETEARAKGLSIRVGPDADEPVRTGHRVRRDAWCAQGGVDARTERILGFAPSAFEGGELASVVHTAMVGDLPWTVLKDFIYPHPGLAESLNNLFDSWV
jgi:pyruvate/2-oxoglutarate dehydrogenase complex dihydrolipoamide dehydrogenase (E3) component